MRLKGVNVNDAVRVQRKRTPHKSGEMNSLSSEDMAEAANDTAEVEFLLRLRTMEEIIQI